MGRSWEDEGVKGHSDVLVSRWNVDLILYLKRYVRWLFIGQSSLVL